MKCFTTKLLFIFPSSLFIFPFFVCFSQEEQKVPVIEAKIDYKAIFSEAETYLMDENYVKALPLYETLLTQNPTNGSWNFKIGLCYLHSASAYGKSIFYLENAIAACAINTDDNSYKEVKAPIVAFLYLGDAYHRNFRFEDAIDAYKKFKTYLSSKGKSYLSQVDYKIQICKNAQELTANPVTMQINNMGENINSPYADYSPVLSADESILLFTSRRPENVGGKTDEEGKYYEDIYIAYRNEDEMGWLPAKNVGSPINTSDHEATIGTSIDGQILFIYKYDADSGSIYVTSMQGDNWSVPEKMGGDVNSKYWETHATLSADGNTLYFVSNRPGGFGGRDIYQCKKLPTGEWSRAMNLGPHINTPYEEDSPFLQPGNNTLYFSSQGHKSMGGFDIFSSTHVDTGIGSGWSEPENIGYPINTTGDDLFYVPTIDKKRAYYSSASHGGFGDNDIYLLTLPEKEESKLTVLRGNVIDDFGNVPTGASIAIADASNGDMVGHYLPNSQTGKYIFILPHNKTYKITYEAEGFHPIINTYQVAPGKEYLETEMIFVLKEVRMERKVLGTLGVFGVITDIEKKPVKDVVIHVIDNSNGKSEGDFSGDNKGKFQFVLKRGRNYNLSFESNGYLMQSENINMPMENNYSSVERNVTLQPIAEGSAVVLKNLFFDSNKSKIRKDSYVELNYFFQFMKNNPDIMIEVSGYTDNKGDDKLNLKLSQDRAKAVMDYLVKKGIHKTRFTYKGYGKDFPIVTNDTDEGRQMNRRVEMRILGK